MNVKKYILLITLVFLYSIVSAQSFKGTVLDSETNEPIPFANVYFVELHTGTSTNENGVFTIEHYPIKKIHIQISYVGYQTTNNAIDLSSVSEMQFFLKPSHVDLVEVVVSVPMGKLQGENIVSVEQKKIDQLKQNSPLTLAEAISNIPGVEQRTTGAGIGKPVIRGLSSNRIVIFAQGMRVENQQWGDEHGLGVGEVGIESVEIIKGPASLLYGSDALGGVLYFVDERYAKHNTIETYASSRFLINSLANINNLAIKVHKGRLKLNAFGTYSSASDYQRPDQQRVFNTRFDEKNFKSSLGFDLNNWISNIRYSFLQNNVGISQDTMITTTDRKIEVPYQTIDNHMLSVENIFFIGNSKLSTVAGFMGNHRKEFEDSPNQAALDMDLQTYSYNVKWNSPLIADKLSLIIGSQGMHQTNKNSGQETLIPDAVTSDIGGFAIGNLDLGKLQFQAGFRGDYRQITTEEVVKNNIKILPLSRYFSSANYSGGGIYKLGATTVRVNISSGFRAPNSSELLSYGVHEGTNRFELGNANLKSELATQVDFTLDYKSEHLSFAVNPFYNSIQNYIYLAPTDTSIDNSPVYEYRQSSAILYGGEAGFHYHPHAIHWLHLESNVSTVFAEDEGNNPLPLIPATRLNSTLKAEFSKKGNIKIKEFFLQHQYKFRQDRTGSNETPSVDYHLLNLGINVEISGKQQVLELTAGIKNLLNARYIDHLSRFKELGIPNPGISFYIGLKIHLEKSIEKASVKNK